MIEPKITKVSKKITTRIDMSPLQYSPEDIRQLILRDAIQKGYSPKTVSFSTDYKYVEDEWGMNRSQISYLKGAIVELRSF